MQEFEPKNKNRKIFLTLRLPSLCPESITLIDNITHCVELLDHSDHCRDSIDHDYRHVVGSSFGSGDLGHDMTRRRGYCSVEAQVPLT